MFSFKKDSGDLPSPGPVPEPKPDQDKIATLVINCNVRTGRLDVHGHLDNKYLALQMLAEAAHCILTRKTETVGSPPELTPPN